MKIYFDASLSGKKEYLSNYKDVVSLIEKFGHKLIASTVFDRNPDDIVSETSDEAASWYKGFLKSVAKADICVFEVSHPSTGIGHEVAMALNTNKPVIALHVKGRRPFVLESINQDKLQVIQYEPNNLKSTLEAALDYASDQQDTRFNFFISPKIANYLDWISRTKRLPRAVYLRKLIENHLDVNEEYKDY